MPIQVLLFHAQSETDARGRKRAYLEATLERARTWGAPVFLHTAFGELMFEDLREMYVDLRDASHFLEWLEGMDPETTMICMDASAFLWDVEQSQAMLAEHTEGAYDFSYSDLLPRGLLPELVQAGVAPFVKARLPEGQAFFQQSFRELLGPDLASYDVNLWVHDSPLFAYRMDFVAGDPKYADTLEAWFTKRREMRGVSDVEKQVQADPAWVRGRPSFYEIELTRGETQMSLEVLRLLFQEIAGFSPRALLNFGLFGNSFAFEAALELRELFRAYPGLDYLMEGPALQDAINSARTYLEQSQAKLVLEMSATWDDPEVAQAIRALPHPERVYLQWTRRKQTESQLLDFCRAWQDFHPRILIRSLGTLGGQRHAERVADFAPIRRFACSKLAHDVVIAVDGTVPLCRESVFLDTEGSIAHISDGLPEVWRRLGERFARQMRTLERGESFPPPCQHCDAWWIFSA